MDLERMLATHVMGKKEIHIEAIKIGEVTIANILSPAPVLENANYYVLGGGVLVDAENYETISSY